MKSVNTLATAELAERVYRHILAQPLEGEVSLLGGQMGFAMLECYYQQYKGESVASHTWDRISASLEAVQSGELFYSYAVGIAGVAWGFLHLFNHGLVQDEDLDAQSIVEDLDQPLTEVAVMLLQEGNYDYLHGALGVCLYLLERTPSTAINEQLTQIVEQLSAIAVHLPNGEITWPYYDFGKPKEDQDSIIYNLGLSHGTASIVAVLTLLYKKGYAQEQCAELIHGNLQWLWENRNRSGASVFPDRVQGQRLDRDTRMAWCYGDLGLANTFWLAGEKLNNDTWKQIAEQTIVQAASRRGDETKLVDAAICHGTAGAAYIFRRFSQRIQNPVLVEAADYWLQKTLEWALPITSNDVFQSHQLDGTYATNLGMLDGEASVGLVLLAELGAPTNWDRFLLLS